MNTFILTAQNSEPFAELSYLDGNLHVTVPVALSAMKHVTGDVIVDEAAALDAPCLQDIGGAFITYGVSRADALSSVGRHCYVYKGGDLRAENLERVDGGFYLYPDAKCVVSKLRGVGGGVSLNSPIALPHLEKVPGGLWSIQWPPCLPSLRSVIMFMYSARAICLN